MRRVLPWALLGLLVVGVAAGAAVGQIGSPKGVTPAQWVDGVVGATLAAGSAHLQYENVTTSRDPSEASVATGIGVVDFTNDSFQVMELIHQHQFESINGGALRLTDDNWSQETIAIGRTLYTNLTSAPSSVRWTTANLPRNLREDFGLASTGAEDALGGLVGPTPVDAVRMLGVASVNGVTAIRYLINTEPLYVCGAHGQTAFVDHFAPTTIWVDGQDRLLRARTSISSDGFTSHSPGGSGSPVAPSTTISTLTFSQLGTPVRITAPQLNGSTGGSSVFSVSAKGSTSPCRG